MLSNVSQNTSGVRVVLFFLAFVGVCVYTPVLIDSLIQRGGNAKQQITHGGDPTTVLEPTGAGRNTDVEKCDSSDYIYGESLDGHMFVKKTISNLYAVDIDGVVEFFLWDGKENLVRYSEDERAKTEIASELSSVLAYCLSSKTAPISADINFKPRR